MAPPDMKITDDDIAQFLMELLGNKHALQKKRDREAMIQRAVEHATICLTAS